MTLIIVFYDTDNNNVCNRNAIQFIYSRGPYSFRSPKKEKRVSREIQTEPVFGAIGSKIRTTGPCPAPEILVYTFHCPRIQQAVLVKRDFR